jgi:hypothetical protein
MIYFNLSEGKILPFCSKFNLSLLNFGTLTSVFLSIYPKLFKIIVYTIFWFGMVWKLLYLN